jgi:hypothetical protein
MSLFIPKPIIDEAKSFARETMSRALDGAFGLIEQQLERRQSAEFAVEKALFHGRLAETLPAVIISGQRWRIRRHKRLAARWAALAFARGAPQFASRCGLNGSGKCV